MECAHAPDTTADLQWRTAVYEPYDREPCWNSTCEVIERDPATRVGSLARSVIALIRNVAEVREDIRDALLSERREKGQKIANQQWFGEVMIEACLSRIVSIIVA